MTVDPLAELRAFSATAGHVREDIAQTVSTHQGFDAMLCSGLRVLQELVMKHRREAFEDGRSAGVEQARAAIEQHSKNVDSADATAAETKRRLASVIAAGQLIIDGYGESDGADPRWGGHHPIYKAVEDFKRVLAEVTEP